MLNHRRRPMSQRDYLFSIAAGLTLAVAFILFYKTVLVDHPEFVSGTKLLAGLIAWLALLCIVAWLARERSVRFWSVSVLSLLLVAPTLLEFVRSFIQWLCRAMTPLT